MVSLDFIIAFLRTATILLTFALTLVWLSPLFPQYNIFSKRAGSALETLYSMEQRTSWETKNGSEKTISTGLISKGQNGFEWVRRAVVRNRPGVRSDKERHGEIVKIGLAKGDSEVDYDGTFGDIIPGNFAFVEFDDGDFVPFLKDEQEQRVISTWTNREVERFTGNIIVGLIFLWTFVSLLVLWL